MPRPAPSEASPPQHLHGTRDGRLLRILLVASALSVAAPALALNHESLACLECHARLETPAGGWGDRGWRELGICLECHDVGLGNAPDVARDAPDALAAGLVSRIDGRPAGALNFAGDGGGTGAGYHELSGHTIGSHLPPPGFGRSWPAGTRLVCRSCHAIHSNGNFRNLGPDPYLHDAEYLTSFAQLFAGRALPSFAVLGPGAPLEAVTADVLLVREGTGAGNRPPFRVVYLSHPQRQAMNEFCATCHPAFHGEKNTREGSRYVRHPTSGVPIEGRVRERLAAAKQLPRLSYSSDGTAEVACLTCHRAHGTRNAFGLVHWDPTSEANGEDGAGAGVESLCLTCHRFDP